MAAQLTVAQITTARDNLFTAYTAVSSSSIAEYTLGDRTFRYEDREKLWVEIQRLTKIILLRDTTFNARGRNRADMRVWG